MILNFFTLYSIPPKKLFNTLSNNNHFRLLIVLVILLVTVYGVFIMEGGFGPSDDLNFVANSDRSFRELFLASVTRPGHVSRPIYGLIQVFTLVAFGDNPVPYNILKLVLWFSTVGVLSYTVRVAFGLREAWIFVFLALLPIFTSSNIFASFQMGYFLSVLFWSLSLVLSRRYRLGQGKYNYHLSYFCVLLALLSCEVILPLLVVTAFLPIVYSAQGHGRGSIGSLFAVAWRFISPVILLCLGFLIFKLYLSKSYQVGEGTYGLSPVTAKSFLQGGYYFFALAAEVPLMLITVIPHLLRWKTVLVSMLIVLFFLVLRKTKNAPALDGSGGDQKKIESLLLWVILLSLIACSSIFVLSGYPAVTFGNYNKMLLPSFLLVCILLAWGSGKLVETRWIVAVIGVSILWTSSMIVQISNYCASWEIRKKVLYDCAQKMNETNLGSEPYVIACVPFFTENNYNNEHLFWLSWDFSSGLKLYGLDKLSSAFPFCWQTLINPNYYSLHNINHHVVQLPENANLWYYVFDLETNQSSVQKMESHADLKEEFQRVKNNKVNRHSIILRQKIRVKLKEWVIQRAFL